MIKKIIHVNFSLVIAILFSILFQSFDSYTHFKKELSEPKCVHESDSKHQITHQHHSTDHCFICKFSLSAAVASDIFVFTTRNQTVAIQNSFFFSEVYLSFTENSNPLRGPPIFNV